MYFDFVLDNRLSTLAQERTHLAILTLLRKFEGGALTP